MVDDLSTTPLLVDDLAISIGAQFYYHLTPRFSEMVSLFEQAASDIRVRLIHGNFHLTLDEYRAMLGLNNNLEVHHENLRALARILYDLIHRTGQGS
jgi:hypothetical protein